MRFLYFSFQNLRGVVSSVFGPAQVGSEMLPLLLRGVAGGIPGLLHVGSNMYTPGGVPGVSWIQHEMVMVHYYYCWC